MFTCFFLFKIRLTNRIQFQIVVRALPSHKPNAPPAFSLPVVVLAIGATAVFPPPIVVVVVPLFLCRPAGSKRGARRHTQSQQQQQQQQSQSRPRRQPQGPCPRRVTCSFSRNAPNECECLLSHPNALSINMRAGGRGSLLYAKAAFSSPLAPLTPSSTLPNYIYKLDLANQSRLGFMHNRADWVQTTYTHTDKEKRGQPNRPHTTGGCARAATQKHAGDSWCGQGRQMPPIGEKETACTLPMTTGEGKVFPFLPPRCCCLPYSSKTKVGEEEVWERQERGVSRFSTSAAAAAASSFERLRACGPWFDLVSGLRRGSGRGSQPS